MTECDSPVTILSLENDVEYIKIYGRGKDMDYLIVSESSLRYYWELQTLFYNLTQSRQVPKEEIILLTYGDETYSTKLKEEFGIEVHHYEDDRPASLYLSSIRPWLIAKFLEEYPERNHFVYLDSDVIMLKSMDWNSFWNDEKVCYGSYVSYVTDDFILQRTNGQYYLDALNQLLPLTELEREKVHAQPCGAQWVLNNMTSDFFYQVYQACEDLFQYWMKLLMTMKWEVDEKNVNESDIWTTDMFVLHRLLILAGYQVEVSEAMSFAFPQKEIEEGDDYLFLHNAGVNPQTKPDHKYLFWKGAPDWRVKLPYETNLSYVEASRYSRIYVKEMLNMKGFLND